MSLQKLHNYYLEFGKYVHSAHIPSTVDVDWGYGSRLICTLHLRRISILMHLIKIPHTHSSFHKDGGELGQGHMNFTSQSVTSSYSRYNNIYFSLWHYKHIIRSMAHLYGFQKTNCARKAAVYKLLLCIYEKLSHGK